MIEQSAVAFFGALHLFDEAGELAHAKVNYSSLAKPLQAVTITKRIPIRDTLTEAVFIGELEAVEAAINSTTIVAGMELIRFGVFKPPSLPV